MPLFCERPHDYSRSLTRPLSPPDWLFNSHDACASAQEQSDCTGVTTAARQPGQRDGAGRVASRSLPGATSASDAPAARAMPCQDFASIVSMPRGAAARHLQHGRRAVDSLVTIRLVATASATRTSRAY